MHARFVPAVTEETMGYREARVVRPGHYRSLDYMSSSTFRGVKELFERVPEFGGVYFRPIDNRVTVVDLHPDSPKPRVGVGSDPYIRIGATADSLAASIPDRIAHLRAVRGRQRAPSRENQFEACLIRAAQADHLRLPGFAEGLRFVHSQWRSDPPEGRSAKLPDLIAVDLATQGLALIELKARASYMASDQVTQYQSYFGTYGDELRPFFARLAQVMGGLYDCPEMAAIDSLGDALSAFVAWPGSDRVPEVHGC
jgi:hypothetical protein